MIVIGLTGGIATGKSTVAALFRRLKVPALSADRIVQQLYRPKSPLLKKIRQQIGPKSINPQGRLNRTVVAAAVFSHPHLKARLEAIVHPFVMHTLDQELAKLRRKKCKIAVVEIPLLFEARTERRFDKIIVVRAPQGIQIKRVMQRYAQSAADARRRIKAQWPLTKKIARADSIIDGFGPLSKTRRQVASVVREVGRVVRHDPVRRGRRHSGGAGAQRNLPRSRRNRAR